MALIPAGTVGTFNETWEACQTCIYADENGCDIKPTSFTTDGLFVVCEDYEKVGK